MRNIKNPDECPYYANKRKAAVKSAVFWTLVVVAIILGVLASQGFVTFGVPA